MTNEYFYKRSVKDAARRINLTERFINSKIKKYYEISLKEIQLEIQELYENFADKENIKLLDAKKKISDADLENIDFELLTKYALKNNDNALLKYVSTLSVKSHITRLELLNLEIQKTLSKLFHQEQTSLYEYLLDTYKDSYFRGIYNIQTYFQIGYDFIKPNDEVIKVAITKDWAKSNYSKRLWGHRDKLADELSEHVNVGLIQGKSIDEMAKKIAKDMNVSLNNAIRLVRTETNYIHNQATLDTYINYAGIEQYRYLATLDFKTSAICQELDGKVFDVKDAKVGTIFPPMHPHCRSTTTVYFKDEPLFERIARSSDGKSYYVPEDITYKDWFNNLSENEKGKMRLNLKKHQNRSQDIKQLKRYRAVLGKNVPRGIDKFQNIKYSDKNKWNELKHKYRVKK